MNESHSVRVVEEPVPQLNQKLIPSASRAPPIDIKSGGASVSTACTKKETALYGMKPVASKLKIAIALGLRTMGVAATDKGASRAAEDIQKTVTNLRIEGVIAFGLSKLWQTSSSHASTGISPIDPLVAVVFNNDER